MYQQEQVARGIALLDEKEPGWRKKFDPSTLAMETIERCVLGQVYGTVSRGQFILGLTWDTAVGYGFGIPRSEYERLGALPGRLISRGTHPEWYALYDQLTETWIALVQPPA